MSRAGRAGQISLIVAGGVITGLLLGEALLRLLGFSFHLRPERVELGWPKSLATLGDDYRQDSDLLWVRADYARTLAEARRERPDIAFLGDSCTELGGYVPLVLDHLREQVPSHRWTGVNLATAGWSSYQGLQQLRRDVVPLRPRVVTLDYGWNDHWIGFGLEDEALAALLQRTGSAWQDLRLVQLGERAYLSAHRSPENHRVPLAQFRRNLDAMVRLARSHGIEPVLITAPTSHRQGREPRYLVEGHWIRRLADLVPLHQSYVEAVRGVAREDGVVLCDLAQGFAAIPPANRDSLFLKDGIHFNPRGARRAAGFLAECLKSSVAVRRAVEAAP